MSIAIIDYGMANLRSVQKAFEQVGHAARIISRPEEIEWAKRILAAASSALLPPVLAFFL